MNSPPSRTSTSLKKTPRNGKTCPLFLKLATPHVHSLINQNQCLSLPEASIIGSLTVNIQIVPIVWRCSKAHSGTPLCVCHLHSVPCLVPSSMTLAISLEDQNQVVYLIDKFALYPFPPFFQPILIIQNPVEPLLRHQSGNIVTVHFSSPHQQSREEISLPLEGRMIVIGPRQLSTSICPALTHGRQSLMALYQRQTSMLLQ